MQDERKPLVRENMQDGISIKDPIPKDVRAGALALRLDLYRQECKRADKQGWKRPETA